jgi:hypothetical protein
MTIPKLVMAEHHWVRCEEGFEIMLSKRLNTNNTIRFPIVILVIPPSFMA